MTWSYSGDPTSSDVDRCRFIIGDTDSSKPMMQDEEIQYVINTSNANEDLLLYTLFKQAATIFARDIKRSLGPQSEDPSDRLKFFKEQAEKYEKRITSAGLSLPTFAHPKVFSIGMHNNPPWIPGE